MPAVDLSASAASARKAQEAATAAPAEPIPCDTAFIVYKRRDTGQIVITHDINVPIIVERGPTRDEVYGYLHVILKNLLAEQTAGMAAQAGLQLNSFVAQQMLSPEEQQAVMAANG
jgi:hypothetical protein